MNRRPDARTRPQTDGRYRQLLGTFIGLKTNCIETSHGTSTDSRIGSVDYVGGGGGSRFRGICRDLGAPRRGTGTQLLFGCSGRRPNGALGSAGDRRRCGGAAIALDSNSRANASAACDVCRGADVATHLCRRRGSGCYQGALHVLRLGLRLHIRRRKLGRFVREVGRADNQRPLSGVEPKESNVSVGSLATVQAAREHPFDRAPAACRAPPTRAMSAIGY